MAATAEKRTIKVSRKRGLTKTTLARWFREWLREDQESKRARSAAQEHRDKMMEALEREGYEDDKGHRYLDLPEDAPDGYTALQRQRRVSQNVNHDRAEAFLKDKGLWKDCTRVVRTVDEELLAKAVFEGKITEDEFKALIDVRETFAFVPVR